MDISDFESIASIHSSFPDKHTFKHGIYPMPAFIKKASMHYIIEIKPNSPAIIAQTCILCGYIEPPQGILPASARILDIKQIGDRLKISYLISKFNRAFCAYFPSSKNAIIKFGSYIFEMPGYATYLLRALLANDISKVEVVRLAYPREIIDIFNVYKEFKKEEK